MIATLIALTLNGLLWLVFWTVVQGLRAAWEGRSRGMR